MRNRILLRRQQFVRTGNVEENVLPRQVDDAPEPGHEVRARERDAIEREILEVRESRRLRLPRQIAAADMRVVGACGAAHHHDARTLQGVALLALVEHERDARIGQDVFRVQRETRNQQDRRAVEVGRDIDQRAIRIARGTMSVASAPLRPSRRSLRAAALASNALVASIGSSVSGR
jgi:hypothetical protein